MDRGLLDTEADLVLRRVRTDNDGVVVEGEGGAPGAHCPHCGAWSETVHGRYCRQVRELPWGGRPVRLVLTVRTFCCLNLDCPRRTFAESFEPLVARQQQRTESVTELLLDYVEAAGGERGAKLAQHAGIPTSPDTLLRLQREQPAPVRPTPRVLGVDDLALRRGRRYATLLLDLETHEPVDLLPGRSATDFADWLRQHEGVQIIVRDRGGEYADGGRQGAPQARQIADKYHLLANATNAMDETLRGRPLTPAPEGGPDRIAPQDAVAPKAEQEAEAPPDELAATAPVAVLPHSAVEGSEVAPSPRSLRWRERWEQARALRASGRRISQIARELRLSRPTIRKLLAVPAPPWQESPQGAGPLVSSELRPFLPYLQRRWAEGATMSALLRELHARGYHGSWSTLWRALHTWPRAKPTTKGSPPTPAATIRLSRRDRRWLLLRSPEKLTAAEKAVVERLLAADPALATAHRLLQEFRSVSRGGSIPDLDHWLDDAEQSGLPAFVSLAHGIQADREAVEGALTTHWTAGPTEGRICRIKLQKRLGYGRAAFDLLRTRVLVA